MNLRRHFKLPNLLPALPPTRIARLTVCLTFLAAIVVLGVGGYMLIEGWSALDALYMTVIGMTTVGFEEVHPLSPEGKAFTIVLVMVSVGTALYTLGVFTEALVEGDLNRLLGRRRMDREISALADHYIVCGYGRIGRLIVAELQTVKLEFAVIEKNPGVIEELRTTDLLFLEGDATEDDILHNAGIARAKGLFAALNSDAANVFVTLSARRLNSALQIVARAEDDNSEQKLLQVGADRVVAPYRAGGHRMAQAMLRPAVMDFMDITTRRSHIELEMAEIAVTPAQKLAGLTLANSHLRDELGLIIVAVKKATGEMLFNPSASYTIVNGDILIALGPSDAVRRIDTMVFAA